MTTTYLITGGNRGIGLEFVKVLSLRPNTKIITTSRSDAPLLEDLAKERGNITLLKLAVDDVESVKKFGEDLGKIPDLKIDYYISNAGVAYAYTEVHETPRESYINHWTVNALGPIEVFKVVKPFMAAKNYLVFISSAAGSIGSVGSMPIEINVSAYGSSKLALNFLIKQMSVEQKSSVVISLNPGLVATEMGSFGVAQFEKKAENLGIEITPISIEESVQSQLKVIDNLTPEQTGKFLDCDGSELPW